MSRKKKLLIALGLFAWIGICWLASAEPVAAINTFNGDSGDPAKLGRHPAWAGDPSEKQPAWLDSQVQKAVDAGYRNIVFILPFGDPSTPDPMSANQPRMLRSDRHRWDTIDIIIRKHRLAHPDLVFGIYMGYGIDETPDTIDFSQRRAPSYASHIDRSLFLAQHAPLVDLGIDEVWWDLASAPQHRTDAILFAALLHGELGLRCRGEALPRNLPSYDGHLDPAFTGEMGWMALLPYYRQWDTGAWQAREGSDLFVGLRAGDRPTREELESLRDRSIWPFVYSASLYDEVEKVWNVKGD